MRYNEHDIVNCRVIVKDWVNGAGFNCTTTVDESTCEFGALYPEMENICGEPSEEEDYLVTFIIYEGDEDIMKAEVWASDWYNGKRDLEWEKTESES